MKAKSQEEQRNDKGMHHLQQGLFYLHMLDGFVLQ